MTIRCEYQIVHFCSYRRILCGTPGKITFQHHAKSILNSRKDWGGGGIQEGFPPNPSPFILF